MYLQDYDSTFPTQWQIVKGSGTGELSGLRGSGTAVADQPTGGHFTLDYELG